MKKLNTIKQILKRSLKRKIKITESLLVIFLITGGITYSLPIVVGDINSERVEINESSFNNTNSTIYINDRVIDSNDTVEINIKDNGVVIKENLKIWNEAKIESLKNYGMLSLNGGVAINFGSTWEKSEFFYNNKSFNSAEKGIFNNGNYGMAAISNEKNSESIVLNFGLIKNNGDFGMYVEADGENTESFGKNEGHRIINSIVLYKLGFEGNLKDRYEEIGEASKLVEEKESSKDGVSNNGNYGMVALSLNGGNASQINYGMIENTKDYGMIAQSVDMDSNSRIENIGGEEMLFYTKDVGAREGEAIYFKNENGVKNSGNYGMSVLAQSGGKAEGINSLDLKISNQGCTIDSKSKNCQDPEKPESKPIFNIGLVSNAGDYGMIGTALENGEALLINESLGISYQRSLENQVKIMEKVILELNGGVKNKGDYGMVAFTDNKSKSTAINKGLIANVGDYGMYSEGDGSSIENYGISLYFEMNSRNIESSASLKIEGGIKNEGNYGMAVDKGGELLNKGLIQNTGDYGIYILNNSIGENSGRDLNGVQLINNLRDISENEILENLKDMTILGGVRNEGNIGVYVGENSYFINHGVINPEGITKTLEGRELLKALGFSENEKVAIVGGTGHNTITLGTGSEISGKVSGGLGDNTLHFIDTYDDYTGEIIENNIYGDIVPKSFSHMIFGKNKILVDKNGDLVFEEEGISSNSKWKIKEEIVLDYHKDTNKSDYTAIVKNGKLTITTDKFNSIYINGAFLERDKDRDIINKLLTGNVSFENGANLVKHVGKNVTSTLAANSINMNGGTITQRVLDNLFVTTANRIEITNIFTSGLTDQQKRVIEEKGLLINGEQASGNTTLPEEYFKVESIGKGSIAGWTSWHEYDPITGDVTLIFERENIKPIDPINPVIPDKGTHGLQGGYAQSIDKYTQSNVDIINTMYIKNQGYNYARRTAFIPKNHSVTKEQIVYPVHISDKGLTLGKENIQSPVVEIIEVENGERYNNLQMAEIFGDYGRYTGSSTSEFNYDTWGVTGGTFHRINDQWLIGTSYGYGKSKVDYKTGEGGKEDIDTIGLNLFLTYEKNNWLSINTIGYSWNKHDLSRKIYDRDSEILGKYPIQTMSADFNSHLISIGSEFGYRYFLDEKSYLYPYVGLDYIWYTRDGYKESGDSYALEIDEKKLNTFVSKLGLLYEKTWEKIGVFGDIGWQHCFEDFRSFDGKFYNEGSSKYRIEGLDIGKDIGYVRVGVNYNFSSEISMGIDYTGAFRSNEFSNIVGLNIEYRW